MVPQCQCCIWLCPCVYGLKHYDHLNHSCPFCFLFFFFFFFFFFHKFKKVGKIDVAVALLFQLGYLNDHLFREERFIWFTVRVDRERLSICVCASFPFGFEVGCGFKLY